MQINFTQWCSDFIMFQRNEDKIENKKKLGRKEQNKRYIHSLELYNEKFFTN
jgi:hypothetical protein